jgi:hypothetical protein
LASAVVTTNRNIWSRDDADSSSGNVSPVV